MTDCLLGEKSELVIQLKTRSKTKAKSDAKEEDDDDAPSRRKKARLETRTIAFPSTSPQEAWKFSVFGPTGAG